MWSIARISASKPGIGHRSPLALVSLELGAVLKPTEPSQRWLFCLVGVLDQHTPPMLIVKRSIFAFASARKGGPSGCFPGGKMLRTLPQLSESEDRLGNNQLRRGPRLCFFCQKTKRRGKIKIGEVFFLLLFRS